jgi:hypothetical protein
MIAVVWQFSVKEGMESAFEELYGASGDWTALSRRSRSYLGSSFLRDAVEPNKYLVIEYWGEMLVYERHQEDFSDEIERLERRRTELLESGGPTGIFHALDVPDRTGPTWSRRTAPPRRPVVSAVRRDEEP